MTNESKSSKLSVITKPAKFWIGTIPHTSEHDLCGRLNELTKSGSIQYTRGQRELGEQSGFLHWQIIVNLKKPQRLSWLKKEISSNGHWEPTKSDLAESYVWKDATAIAGTRFEFGAKPVNRSSSKDWDAIKDAAKCGRLDDIPSDIYIRCYQSLRRIQSDHLEPIGIERKVFCFWGCTGTGKSRRAWEEAGLEAYPKDPRTKFWDGYRAQEHVVIDEFRGGIDIGHVLRWLDRYPVIVEIKGSATVLKAKTIWITSNLPPELWYPEIDDETRKALLRRLEITYFQ